MKKALIFKGGWEGHHPNEIASLFRDMLQGEGFEVAISDTLDVLADESYLKSLNLIVPAWTMGEIDEQYVTNVCNAVESGVGLCGCHGGMCDAFRNSTQWQFLTGAQWVAHPGNGTVEYSVNLKPDNYFTRGLQDFRLVSEQYYLHVDPAVKVYATTTFSVFDGPHAANGSVDMPVIFTKLWGNGRVFYNSVGHTEKEFEQAPAAKEMMRRGFIWAADKEVEA